MKIEKGHYYKFMVNGTEGEPTRDYNGEQWTKIVNIIEGRGGHAIWYRQSVCSASIIPLLSSPERWIEIDEFAIGPWEIFAELDYRI